MSVVRTRSVVTALWLVCAVAAAQITFSRDWTGGKRAPAPLPADCAQFATLCRHVVHELKRSMSAELTSKRRQIDDEPALLYDDDN